MKIRPYIGITDFMDPAKVYAMIRVFRIHNPTGNVRRLMVGVMMTRKTLNGIPSKWTNAMPRNEKVADIFMPSYALDDIYNTLHYADYEGIDVEKNIHKATLFGGPFIQALQLDMIWPNPAIVQRYKDRNPDIEIILQAGTNALDAIRNNPSSLVTKIREYGTSLTHILLDRSMGRGAAMKVKLLKPLIAALKDHCPHIGIAVAGGLGPDTLHLVEPLVELYPDISIDAQSQLRPSGSALDPIDWDMASEYLYKAIVMFHNAQKTYTTHKQKGDKK